MRVVCMSDTHGLHERVKVPGGDVLIHAGDFTHHGDLYEVRRFFDWLGSQPHDHKILIAGNHDFWVERQNKLFVEKVRRIPRVTYLQDSGAEIVGFRVWGSPVTPWFYDWAFNRQRGAEIQEHWDLIPTDTQILVTHGPPIGILDRNFRGENHGCADLRDVIDQRLSELKLHVFGHMHPGGGQQFELDGRLYVNAAICDERGYATRDAVVVDLL